MLQDRVKPATSTDTSPSLALEQLLAQFPLDSADEANQKFLDAANHVNQRYSNVLARLAQ